VPPESPAQAAAFACLGARSASTLSLLSRHAEDGYGGELDTDGTVDCASAPGRVQISGVLYLDNGDVGSECDTGVLHWTASR
jgi:hypothetical protein